MLAIAEKVERIRMGNISKGEFDFDKLPEGIYSFSGQEGIVKVKVDRNGKQSWDLENWFASLDPDDNQSQRKKVIQDIKNRLNAVTGIIDPPKKHSKINFPNPFNSN